MKRNVRSTTKWVNALLIIFLVNASCCPKLIDLSGKRDFKPKIKKLNSVVLRVKDDSTEFQDIIDLANNVIECPCKDSDGTILKLLIYDDLTPLQIEGPDGIADKGNGREGDTNLNFEFNFIDQFDDLDPRDLEYITPTVTKGESLNNQNFNGIDLNSIPNLDFILDKVFPSKKIGDLVLNNNSDRPVIAVLDTGLDPAMFMESEPFLHNTTDLATQCSSVNNMYLSGWNFVDNNNNIFDGQGHGSLVTKIITDNIDMQQTKYNILPLKILNDSGTGTYWNVVCALSYLSNIQKSTGNLKIINSSFGGVLPVGSVVSNVNIFSALLEKLEGTIMVSSAGNVNENNDLPMKYHFPSNVESDQVLAVGGYKNLENGTFVKHESSNYGLVNVDVATLFEGYKVEYKKQNQLVKVSGIRGTSFGAAYISSQLLNFMENESSLDPISLAQFLNIKAKKTTGLAGEFKEGNYIEVEN